MATSELAPEPSPASVMPARPRGHRVAFWFFAWLLFAYMFAAAAPSPLYVVYQAKWGFSATVLTIVFAVYALALLLALITTGALSDHLGRRPVLKVAIVLEGLAMLMFVAAGDVTWLLAARIVQGLATGLVTGAISAALLDLQPPDRPGRAALINSAVPGIGLAAGALGSGLLGQYAPSPTTLVFALLTIMFALALACVILMPETAPRRPGALASLLPRFHVPVDARKAFFAVVPILIASWSVVGLYMSLGGSLAAGLLGSHNRMVGGLVVFALMLASATGSVLSRRIATHRAMISGASIGAVGLVVTLGSLPVASLPLFLIGTVIAGFGLGVGFLGAFAALSALAEPQHRAALFATIFTVNYLAFSLPAVIAGAAIPTLGLLTTTNIYGGTAIVIALAAVFLTASLGRRKAAVATS